MTEGVTTARAVRQARNRASLLALMCFVVGASRPSGQATQATPIFRQSIGYVTLAVVVTDSDGRPVKNLTREDFEVIEAGRPQSISDFRFVEIPVRRRPASTVDVSEDVFSSHRSAYSRQFVVVIDDLHIVESSITPVKQLVSEFVGGLSTDDEIAVAYVNRSDLAQDFTTDHRLALKAVSRVRDALGFGLDAGKVPRYSSTYRRSTLSVIRNVVASLGASTRPKRAMILVSDGFQTVLPQDDELLDALVLARRLNVPIYTIDPRGLIAPEDAVRGGIGALDSPGARRAVQGAISGQHNTLVAIASNTNGQAFINRSNLAAAVEAILTDNSAYYVLGYYPEHFVQDGKFHSVAVRARRPGLHVRGREGYVSPSRVVSADANAERTLEKTLALGREADTLRLRAVVMPMRWTGKRMTTLVTAELDDNLVVGNDARRVYMQVLGLDPEGKVTANFRREFANSERVYPLNLAVDLPVTTRTLRVGVIDSSNGAAGSVAVPLSIPNPRGKDIELSGIALAAGRNAEFGSLDEEMLRNLTPFQPSTRREFSSDETIHMFANTFWRSDIRSAVPDALVRIKGAGRELTEPVPMRAADLSHELRYASILLKRSLVGLEPGRYTLEAVVRLPNGRSASRAIPFTITADREGR